MMFLLATALAGCASTKAGLGPVSKAAPPAINELTSLDVDVREKATDISIDVTTKPIYSVYRMSDPQRVLVDFNKAKIGGIEAMTEINNGLINVIATNQFKSRGQNVARIMIGFDKDAEFVVREEEKRLVLRVEHPAGFTPVVSDAKEASETVAAEAKAEEKTEEAPATAVEEPVVVATPVVEEPICKDGEPQLLTPYEGKKSKAKLRSVAVVPDGEGVALKLSARGHLAKGSYEVLRLCNPDRMVIDLYGVRNKTQRKTLKGDGEFVENVRLGSHKDKLRIVLDLKKYLPDFDLKMKKNRILVSLHQAASIPAETRVAAAEKEKLIEREAPVKESVRENLVAEPMVSVPVPSELKPIVETEETAKELAKIQGIDFKHRSKASTIEINIDKIPDYKLTEESKDQFVLEIPKADIPEHLEQSLDTSEFDSPVSLISSYVADKDTNTVKIVVQTRYETPNRISTNNGVLTWEFDRKADESLAEVPAGTGRISLNESGETIIEYQPGEAAGVSGALAPISEASKTATAAGQRISLELKNTDILDVLRLIADVSKLNIITSDNVRGTVTVRLLNVPWQQALDIILRSKGLGKERQGNIIRVAPLAVLQREREMRINQLKAQRELEPLSVRLIPVSYSEAKMLLPKVRDLLSNRGTVNFDERTNVIIVKDIDEVLAKAESLISKLDLQTPQVMIEAKIVEADVTNELGWGIQWGGYYTMSEQTGNPTGLAYPANFGIAGAQDYASHPGLPNANQPPNWVVNTPTTSSAAMGLGITLGNAQNTHNLTLRLTALESSGKIKIISSPRISTLDNKEATIEQGLRIPIMSLSVAGVPVSKMVNAKLRLKVTPHITADGSIIMKLNIMKEEPDFSRTNALGDPAIVNKQASTEVLVRTGETTVIGGIYTKKNTVKEFGVPFLKRIPVLGYLFKNKTQSNQKTELLIFVTPRIINRSQSSLVAD